MSEGTTIGSLFSGIGGLELGLERAGLGPTVWQVEADPFCRRVLAKHWPEAGRYDDVRTARDLAPVDIVCGGFPCQDLSYAGSGAGLDGARSGLWFEYLRIVRALRPRFVVVENVPALLTRGLGVVLGGLAESGYDAVWDCIPAQSVGAPHRRDRVFVVAYADEECEPRLSERAGATYPSAGIGGRACRSRVAGSDGRQRWRPKARSDHRRDHTQGCDAASRSLAHEWPPAPGDMHAWGRLPVASQPQFRGVVDGLSDWIYNGRR